MNRCIQAARMTTELPAQAWGRAASSLSLTCQRRARHSARKIFWAILMALLLGGCGPLLKTPYSAPEVSMPQGWSAASAPTAESLSTSLAGWSSGFGDPVLDRLVEQALLRNNDLAAATIRVRRAQLQAGLAADQMIPALGATASTSHEKDIRHGGGTARAYALNGSVSYEADLWGKLSSQYDAAKWEALATEQDRQSTALSLVGTTMNLYWRIAYLNVRIDLSGQSIAYAEKTLALVRAQYRSGAASSLQVSEAEQSLASQQADQLDLLQQRVEAYNALALLFDGPPGDIVANPQVMPEGELPPVDAGLPAELLGRRPDLQAAELRLRKLLADTDATRASFYPSLTLTGTLGSSSTSLSEVLRNPIAALATQLALPFLQWNEMRLSVKSSQAEYEEAVVNLRQTLYQALGEVENALSARRMLAEQGASLERALAAARQVERMYEVRYRAGYVSLNVWLDAQETRRTSEIALAENLLNRLANHVTLLQALGGEAALPSQPL
ncbi:RND efflux system, outer membrane lipoprotein, NodT family [Desulfocurvibacter africanus subsp. africanus str. Walvis Bay]|uniref:RND efflux system, outer membrane lipoprotein, NodT family n=2 Tax=Desulfocurvibacter africanus TaxID=873 RepID=F3Z396_DESAF|nr:RND efflux system, outer membrane lipoprotein, NodT family [Desulfocurvibacter africanus subsp. africanus str. Walvis Bay]